MKTFWIAFLTIVIFSISWTCVVVYLAMPYVEPTQEREWWHYILLAVAMLLTIVPSIIFWQRYFERIFKDKS